jgi:nickel/cobalt exporter
MRLDAVVDTRIVVQVVSTVKRWGRYGMLFIFSVGLVCSLALATSAQTLITWEDLQPSVISLQDPYAQLAIEQTYDLATLARLQAWVQENKASPDSLEAQEALRLEQRLRDQGLDVTALLAQVDQARLYWQQQSQGANADLVGEPVQLSGYALPLSWSDTQRVTEFLLVPYVGACIHVPPPPPNQIVYIKPPSAIEPPGLFAPVTVEGILRPQSASYELFRVDGSRPVEVSYALTLTTLSLPPAEDTPTGTLPPGSWWQTLPVRVSAVLTQAMGNLDRQRSPASFGLGLLIAFSYGVLHTLGPGHGKAVIIAYFVGQGGSLRRGLTIGVRIAVFHVLSAIVVVVLADRVIRQVGGATPANYPLVQLISYGAIATIGGYLLWQALQFLRTSSKQGAVPPLPPQSEDDKAVDRILYPSLSQQALSPQPSLVALPHHQAIRDCRCLSCEDPKRASDWLSLAIGAVPCSGAVLILFYGLANNLLWPSVAMVVAISLGMAVTLAWIGIMAIFGRQYTDRRLARQHQSYLRVHRYGQILGASSILLIGLGLFGVTLLTGG